MALRFMIALAVIVLAATGCSSERVDSRRPERRDGN